MLCLVAKGFSAAQGLDWGAGGEGAALTVICCCGLMLPDVHFGLFRRGTKPTAFARSPQEFVTSQPCPLTHHVAKCAVSTMGCPVPLPFPRLLPLLVEVSVRVGGLRVRVRMRWFFENR